MGPAIYKGEDVTGYQYGLYVVLGFVGRKTFPSGNWHNTWRVICTGCDTESERQAQHVVNAKYGCQACKGRATAGVNSWHWKGGRYVPGYFVAQAKSKLDRRSKTLDWTVTVEYLDKVWESQDGRCAYTGLPLIFGDSITEQTASLDRRDSGLGYVPGNVQFVHKDINLMKWSLPEQRFLALCRAVAEYNE